MSTASAARQHTRGSSHRSPTGARSAKPAPIRTTLRNFKVWQIALAFLVLTLIFHSAILFGSKFLWEDFVEQEFPFRTLATTSLAQGIIPQWDPYVFAGMPFIADVQVAFWYPFNMLQSLFVSGGYLSPLVMEWFILLHFAVAGFGMYWFSKEIFDLDDWSAVFAGIAYGFGGYIAAQSIHQMIVYHIALFPYVAYFFLRGVDSWRHGIIGGLILGAMYLAGHPQSTLYFTFFLALLAAYEIAHRARHKSGQLNWPNILRMALPVAIGFGIFAIQFLPSQELANLSRRETITYQNSLDGSLTWGHILTFVLPRLFGLTNGAGDAKVPYWNGPYYLSWETAIYIGVLPLFFAIMAGLLSRKQKYVSFFAGMALLAVAFALGDHFFVYRIFFQLPLFNKFRTPARIMMLFSFAASALAGVGLAGALKSSAPKWGSGKGIFVRILILLPWLMAIAGMLHATTFMTDAPQGADASISWSASLATFPILALIVLTGLHYFGKLHGELFAFLVIAVTVIELFNYGMSINDSPEDPQEAYREQPQLVSMLQKDEAKELSRARTRIGNQMVLKRNQGAYDRIQLTEGYDPLVLQRVFPVMANSEASMDLMNVKWSIIPGQNLGFGMRPGYLPRVKLYYQADILPDSQALARLKTDSTYDYKNRILLEEPLQEPLGPPDPTATAKVTKYGDNEIIASVKTASNAMLFFSEIYYPSWKAYVDGKPAKLYRAFTTLRAVEVPAGAHTVTLRFQSTAFAVGSMITIVTLLLSLGGLALVLIRERRTNTSKSNHTV